MSRVALVVLDTLRKDTFESHFDWLPGTRLENMYSTSHWTVPAHASMFTGKYPSEVGVHCKSQSLNTESETLAEALSREGFTTRMWTGNPNIHIWDGWDRGFDHCLGPTSIDPTADNSFDWASLKEYEHQNQIVNYLHGLYLCARGDESFLGSVRHGYELWKKHPADGRAKSVLKRLEKNTPAEREFLFVNLMDVHTPYYSPDGEKSSVTVTTGDGFSDSVSDPNVVRAAYDYSAETLSRVYKQVYAQLKAEYDHIITISDHGELLGEHGLWNHGYGLYRELVHVPCVVDSSKVDKPEVRGVMSIKEIPELVEYLAGVSSTNPLERITEDAANEPRLFEYHGFTPWLQEQFDRNEIGIEAFEQRDSPLSGIVTPAGEYGFQTHTDGFTLVTEGDEKEIESTLDAMRAEMKTETARSGTPKELSADVLDQLERLGYK